MSLGAAKQTHRLPQRRLPKQNTKRFEVAIVWIAWDGRESRSMSCETVAAHLVSSPSRSPSEPGELQEGVQAVPNHHS